MKRKLISLLLAFCLMFTGCSKPTGEKNPQNNLTKTPITNAPARTVEEIRKGMTLDQKAAQMVQGAVYNVASDDMKKYDYGSILSTYGESAMDAAQWKKLVLDYQKNALKSQAGIPYIYGNDAVHGVNTCTDTVIFPHNIGIGAANDEKLTYEMGKAVANEAKLTGMLWTFSPCVAASQDPRWGRTYES